MLNLNLEHFTGHLNRYARRLLLGNLINAVGMGLTMTLFMVYLHSIRHFSNTFAGSMMGLAALVGIALNPLVGSAIDKWGARLILLFGLLTKTLGTLSLTFVDTKVLAIMATLIMAIGDSCNWTSQSVALSRIVAPEARQRIFAFNFMALNLGIGIGGIISSLVVQKNNLYSFQLLYVLDAITYFVYYIFALSLPKWVGHRLDEKDERNGSFKEVFKIKELMHLFRGSILLIIFGYASVSSGLPLFITSVLNASPKWLGIIWAANCLGIVLMQAPMLRWIERRSPVKVLAQVGFIWSASWLLVALTFLSPWVLLLPLLVTSSVVFGIGETMWSPTFPTVVNELTPDHIRGRSNSLMSLQWAVAGTIGAPVAGLLFDAGLAKYWVAAMVLGSLLPIPILAGVALPNRADG